MTVSMRRLALFLVLPALLAACEHGRSTPSNGTSYAVVDSLAVGDGLQISGGNFATSYYAPQPAGTPSVAQSLNGNGQVVYGIDGSLYRYSNGTGGCAINKYAFGAVGNAAPLATASGDSHLTGSATPLGCFASATDSAGNLYVLVANGTYLGVDVFNAQLEYQYQLGNGRRSGIVPSGSAPSFPLAVDGFDQLYVGEGTTIQLFTTGTNGAKGDAAPFASLAVPAATVALAFDNLGDLYVGSASAVNVYSPAASGGYTLTATVSLPNSFSPSALVLSQANGLATDSLDNLYVLAATSSGNPTQVLLYSGVSAGLAEVGATIPVTTSAGSVTVAPLGSQTTLGKVRRRP